MAGFAAVVTKDRRGKIDRLSQLLWMSYLRIAEAKKRFTAKWFKMM